MREAFTPSLVILYLGRIVAVFGDWIYLISLSLILSKEHATAIGLMWFAKIVGVFLGKIIAGSLADRVGHKKTVIASDFFRALCYLLMPFFLHSWFLFVLVGGASILGSFFAAAYTPLVTLLTNDQNRQRVNSIRSVIGSSSVIMGPLLGAILVLKGDFIPFIIVALTFVLSAMSFFFIKVPAIETDVQPNEFSQQSSNNKFALWDDLIFSFNYIRKNPALLGITVATTILALTSIMEVYEVLFVTNTLGQGAQSYALLVTINGISFLLAGLLNTLWLSKYPPANMYPIGLTLVVLNSIIYSFSASFITLIISSILMNMALMVTHTASDTICQNQIPVSIQGRITSIQGVLPEFISTISTAIAGALLAFVTIRSIFVFVALISILSIPFSLLVLKKAKYSDNKIVSDVV